MSEKLPNWMDNFITGAFGSGDFSTQREMVQDKKEQQSLNGQNAFNDYFRDDSGSASKDGINKETGERYDVRVKKEKITKNKIEQKDLGLQIEFSSGKHKDKYICSSLDDFCNGKFSHLKNESLEKIAKEISDNNKFVFNFLEASTASLSDSIQLETALSIANNITHNAKLLDIDYRKLCSKLNLEDVETFDKCLKNAGISVIKNNLPNRVSYYLDFIKNFEEYKLAKNNSSYVEKLKNRVGAITLTDKELKESLYKEFQNDEILKKI